MNNLINTFFTKEYENEVNKSLLKLDFSLPQEEIVSYIDDIICIPITDYLEWIDNHTFFGIDSSDMPQISSFVSVFYGVVDCMLIDGDKGYKFIDIGKLLLNDGIPRKKGAYTKYGENNAKTAEYMGYLFSVKQRYFVSCLGYALKWIDKEKQDKLYTRLLMRTNLFKAIYLMTKNGEISLRELFDFLSDKTYQRRKGGTKKILYSMMNSEEFDFTQIFSKVIF